MRRLPEFKFWHSVMNSTMIAIFMTCFDALDIPVFWPILVLYFVTLFCVTMKRQIRVSPPATVGGTNAPAVRFATQFLSVAR